MLASIDILKGFVAFSFPTDSAQISQDCVFLNIALLTVQVLTKLAVPNTKYPRKTTQQNL